MTANIWEGRAVEGLVHTASTGCNSLPLNMWVDLFHSYCVLFTTLLGRCNYLLWYRVSENAVVETVAMVANDIAQHPTLLLHESTSSVTSGTGSCRCRPGMEVWSSSHPLPLWYTLLSSPDCSDCASWVTIKGVNPSIYPPQTFLTVLKLPQKPVCRSLVLKSGVLCLEGWEFASLSGLTKEFNYCFAWSGIRHTG